MYVCSSVLCLWQSACLSARVYVCVLTVHVRKSVYLSICLHVHSNVFENPYSALSILFPKSLSCSLYCINDLSECLSFKIKSVCLCICTFRFGRLAVCLMPASSRLSLFVCRSLCIRLSHSTSLFLGIGVS